VTRALSKTELAALFDEAWHLKHVDTIFHRVFGDVGGDTSSRRRKP
jgi:hypothetical protein